MHGYGVLMYRNGTVLKGHFDANEVTSGRVRFAHNVIYEGPFLDNMAHGLGRLKISKAYVEFAGRFKNGQPNGKGIMQYQNRDIYRGNFSDGQRSGEGRLETRFGSAIHNGLWRQDQFIAPIGPRRSLSAQPSTTQSTRATSPYTPKLPI
jgi:hypothetical protein